MTDKAQWNLTNCWREPVREQAQLSGMVIVVIRKKPSCFLASWSSLAALGPSVPCPGLELSLCSCVCAGLCQPSSWVGTALPCSAACAGGAGVAVSRRQTLLGQGCFPCLCSEFVLNYPCNPQQLAASCYNGENSPSCWGWSLVPFQRWQFLLNRVWKDCVSFRFPLVVCCCCFKCSFFFFLIPSRKSHEERKWEAPLSDIKLACGYQDKQMRWVTYSELFYLVFTWNLCCY